MDGKRNAEKPGISKAGSISVALEEQNHTFALDGSVPVNGELHVNDGEVYFRGKNLKPVNAGYKLFFIGRKDGSSVYKIIGNIIPDMYGSAQLQRTVDPADIDGEGTDLSCFYVFMVAAMGKPMQPVLKGDMAERHASVRAEHSESSRHSKKKRAHSSYNEYYRDYILHKIAVLLKESGSKTDISPFDDAWLVSNWKRVTDSSQLPVASIGAEQQIRRYGHFIFGFTEEHFYVGVPGRHIEEEWPDRGKSGFVMWQSICGSDEYGYWTVVIDRNTGIITEIS